MITLNLNIEGVKHEDYNLYFKFCYSKLNDFKKELRNSLNIVKFSLRYDYIVDNNLIKFNDEENTPTSLFIANFIINSFVLTKRANILGGIDTAFVIPDYLLIPFSTMSVTHFIRYVEYGTLDMPPYKWISHTWRLFSENIQDEWIKYSKIFKKLEDN